jgi:hypothetical protein
MLDGELSLLTYIGRQGDLDGSWKMIKIVVCGTMLIGP